MERDALEKLEEVIIKETKNFPQNYRCHEGSRRFAGKLKSLGMDVAIKDGGAVYETSYFLKCFENFLPASMFEDSSEEEKRGIMQELKGSEEIKSKISVLHSWCEVREAAGNPVIIDWHASFKLSPDCGIENHLIIDNKNNLPHTYIPLGVAIGKWVIFRTFPPYAIKLRI